MLGGLAALVLALGALAAEDAPIAQLLEKAEVIRTADHAQFVEILQTLHARQAELSPAQREYVQYLDAWSLVYDGRYEEAGTALESFIRTADDRTLRLRADLSLVNMLVLSGRYDRAYSQLSRSLELLPQISDAHARAQALMVAAQLYNEVGQFDLSLGYSQQLIDQDLAGGGACRGWQLRLRALFDTGRVKIGDPEIDRGIKVCTDMGELFYADIIRMYLAKTMIAQSHLAEAVELLRQHYEEVVQTHYRRLLSEYDALLSQAYRQLGDRTLARQFASSAIDHAVKNEYTEPVVIAYRTLYELAKEEGDYRAALAFHESYATADKGYLDDVSARHLAYQKVSHENISNKLQIEALNKENRVLQLQKELSAKAVETSRLYIAILIMVVIFVVLWAYRTKRSQLHFMSLSQLDGLTGICNRPYFIDQAEKALAYNGKVRQDASMILCDLDHFKAINDKHGHATGDFVLRRTVAACRTHLRKSDIFGRVGGEEFAILLPGCGLEEARNRAEQLRATIAAITVQQGTGRFNVSASFGVAATNSCGYQLRELLAQADAALYEAKRAGRNRVMLYQDAGAPAATVGPTAGDPVTRPFRTQMPT